MASLEKLALKFCVKMLQCQVPLPMQTTPVPNDTHSTHTPSAGTVDRRAWPQWRPQGGMLCSYLFVWLMCLGNNPRCQPTSPPMQRSAKELASLRGSEDKDITSTHMHSHVHKSPNSNTHAHTHVRANQRPRWTG